MALRLVELAATVVGPVTVVTALLYYFGWVRTNAVFRYFGVDPAQLQFASADYLARSAGTAFRPLVILTVIAALLLALARLFRWGDRWWELRMSARVPGRPASARPASLLLFVVSVVVTWCGVRAAGEFPDVFGVGSLLHIDDPTTGAIALAIGPLGIMEAIRPRNPGTRPRGARLTERLVVVLAVFTGLFWATAVYSQGTGEDLARSVDGDPAQLALVTIRSPEPLPIPVAHPVERPPGEPARYTYTDLRLLIYSNERWFLLTPGRGPSGRHRVIVVNDDGKITVEQSM